MADQTPTHELIHRTIAMHIRNDTIVRWTLPAEDRGPTHHRDGHNWLIRLSPREADRAAHAAIDALEELGVIPAPTPSRDELRRQVCGALHAADHPRAGQDDFGWQHHRAINHGPHMLITCTVSDTWQDMPHNATATAVHDHLTRWADSLTAAGLGVATWGRDDRTEALIVAADQATADEQAAIVRPRLAELNPAGGSRG